jgi:hypothetical protein
METDHTLAYVAQWISLALQPQPTTLLNASNLDRPWARSSVL